LGDRARGYRQGGNPARWRGQLDKLLPKKTKVRRVEHHAALPYAELPEFMTKLRQQDGIGAKALEFAILTADRTGEVVGARWGEIDLEGRLWIIPGTRMKGGREHRVPLSEPGLAILDAMRKICQSDYVFAGGRQGRPVEYGAANDVTAYEAGRSHGAWFSVDILRLGGRTDEFSQRSAGNGVGAHCQRQG
jgi:integrase